MKTRTYRPATRFVLLLTMISLALTGCSSLSNTEKGAAIGAGTGAVVGGAIGKAVGSTAKGAIIGTIVGGTAGAVIGQQMDKQAAELEQDLDGAAVQRLGEGIVVTFDSGILFDFDSATLRSASQANLRDLAASLEKYENTDLMIIGHTDAVGADGYNYQLSERRANSAAAYLISQGLPPSRITIVGKGETEPIATNDTEHGRQENRRVEIAIFASEEYRAEIAQRYGS